jgi:hypothetical protein
MPLYNLERSLTEMRRRWIRPLIALITDAFLIGCLSFWNIDAFGSDTEVNSNHLPVDPKFQPRLGTYYYVFDFNSIQIGTGKVVLSREGDFYKMQVFARTNSTIDHIYKIRYKGENIIDAGRLSPVETRVSQRVKSVEKDTTISFQDDGTIKTTEEKSGKGKTKKDEHEIHTEKFTLDPFSVTYLVRVLDWEVGVEQIFDLYTGKSQYELRLKCENTAVIDAGSEKRNAWVIVPIMKKLQDTEEDAKKRPINMKIFVSADEFKDVLGIEADYSIGRFRAVMERFEPAPVPDEPVRQEKTK